VSDTPSKQPKAWGTRWLLRHDSTHETSILWVKAGHRCSWHRHAAKHNLFAVLKGSVDIVTGDGTMRLGEGESGTVRAGVWHEFQAVRDTIMVEEMYVAYDPQDIERSNVGGRIEGDGACATS
jgi:mannose-6-phosphate isomerase-like protein (cupin superfamily)